MSNPLSALFITGTSTEIGKTIVSALLCQAYHHYSIPVSYWKPIQTGSDNDTQTIKNLTALPEDWVINPIYSLVKPVAPFSAAHAENRIIDMDSIISFWKNAPSRHYIIEGAGGLLVPLTADSTIRELILRFKSPVVVVATTQLGTINHTLLTVEALKNKSIPIVGIVLVGVQQDELTCIIEKFSGVKVIAQIPLLSSLTRDVISTYSIRCFPESFLRSFLCNPMMS